MKKLLLFLVFMGLCFGNFAMAQESKSAKAKQFYIGYHFMPVTHVKYTEEDFAEDNAFLRPLGYDSFNFEQTRSSAGSVFYGGKKLSEEFAIELGYRDYGKNEVVYTAEDIGFNTSGHSKLRACL